MTSENQEPGSCAAGGGGGLPRGIEPDGTQLGARACGAASNNIALTNTARSDIRCSSIPWLFCCCICQSLLPYFSGLAGSIVSTPPHGWQPLRCFFTATGIIAIFFCWGRPLLSTIGWVIASGMLHSRFARPGWDWQLAQISRCLPYFPQVKSAI